MAVHSPHSAHPVTTRQNCLHEILLPENTVTYRIIPGNGRMIVKVQLTSPSLLMPQVSNMTGNGFGGEGGLGLFLIGLLREKILLIHGSFLQASPHFLAYCSTSHCALCFVHLGNAPLSMTVPAVEEAVALTRASAKPWSLYRSVVLLPVTSGKPPRKGIVPIPGDK